MSSGVHRLTRLIINVLQLIKMLNEAKGNGTSMISLILPPKSQVRRRCSVYSLSLLSCPPIILHLSS